MKLQFYQKWATEFKMRRGESFEDDPLSGRPATTTTAGNIDFFHHMLMGDKQLTINQLANAMSISPERVENNRHNEFAITKFAFLIAVVSF